MHESQQKSELSQLIKKLKSIDLPKADMEELCSPCPSISWQDFIPDFSSLNNSQTPTTEKCLLLDVRSESEFAQVNIPGSINLPIFNDQERHNVGLLFKQQSEALAEEVGTYYALQKKERYLTEIKKIAGTKKIIVHCWRGGYRSKAVTALLNRNGFKAFRLEGGHKGFRREVHKYLYEVPPKLISLSGKTGTGKSEMLETIMSQHPEIPVLHLEEAALHASSVFGAARFGWQQIEKQQDFETRLYMQMLPWISKGDLPVFLTEKESSQIGRVFIPNGLLTELKKEIHICLISSMTTRVHRLKQEYINNENPENLKNLKMHIGFLKKFITTDELNEYLSLFDAKKWELLLEKILEDYYDKVYKKCNRAPIAEVQYEKTNDAMLEILKIYQNFIHKQEQKK